MTVSNDCATCHGKRDVTCSKCRHAHTCEDCYGTGLNPKKFDLPKYLLAWAATCGAAVPEQFPIGGAQCPAAPAST